jgi:quinolinate synthase
MNIVDQIKKLKKEKNAVILAHFYQDGEIQDIADFIGDSLDLSRKAANTDADMIVFCGVRFMAEVAKILSPQKKVIVPDMMAGCSLEDSCPPENLKKLQQEYPNHITLSYINCSAEVKALSDIIVTSSNAEKIINQLSEDQGIIFAPDRHLGDYLNRKTGRNMVLWQGGCIVHERFSEKELVQLTVKYPKSHIIAHPECPKNLLSYAHHVGSTSSLLKFVNDHQGDEFIVLTESHIVHQMQKYNPEGRFYVCGSVDEAGCTLCSECPYMGLNNMEKLLQVMINESNEILLDDNLINRSKKSLVKMLNMS